MRTTTLAVSLFLALTGSLAAAAPPAADSGYEPNLLDVKFKEGTLVRLRGGRPTDVADQAHVRSDLQGILRAFGEDRWSRTQSVDEEVLDRMRREGQANRAKPLPDLNNYFRLSLPPGLTAARAKEIVQRYASVEAAYFVPKPVAAPNSAPDYSAPPQPKYQDYLDAAPNGIDARNAWSRGWSGAGVKICDVEYGINWTHQDLPPIKIVGLPPLDQWNDDHGTGVWGEMVSKNDGVGTKGIAYGASGYFAGAYTEAGYSVSRALMECGAALSAGDVVLIEQQMAGPNYTGFPQGTQFGLVAMEWSKPVYDAIVTLTANGIVVVETTGNGSQNFDGAAYQTGNDDHWPFKIENDSGAIMVTGGHSPHTAPARASHSYSNYGATVDLQGWGDSIVTSGAYPTGPWLYSAEGRDVYYRSDFGGSSGAGPIVTGAVALLQEAHKQQAVSNGTPASPAFIKHLLVSTGTPQAVTEPKHLGPLPDVKAALDALQKVYYVDKTATGSNNGNSWLNAFNEIQEALQLATAGTRILVAKGLYFANWDPVANVYTNNRAATFQLKNGVAILGGYPNGGGARDPDVNLTFLRGAMGGPGPTDDAYHIVTAGSTIDDTAVLDGFDIGGGYANGSNPNDRGGGILISGGSPVLRQLTVQQNFAAQRGGGIYNENGSPSLQYVTLDGNSTSNKGGGMFNENGGPRFTLVTFSGNTATSEGGGLFTEGGTPHIESARFIGNSGTRGGAISAWLGAAPGGSIVVDSTEFRGNQASDVGGAVFDWQGKLRLNNVTVSANTATTSGGGVYVFDPNTVTIRNSIIWANTGGNINGSTATVSRSIVQGGYAAGTDISTLDPLFRVPGTDLRVKRFSPALDGGDPGSAGPPVVLSTCAGTDVRGVARFDAGLNYPPATCDLGAYEYLGKPGTFWSNGEVDLEHAAPSFDARTSGGSLYQSADDFVVPAGKLCDITEFRGVLEDGTKVSDAYAALFTNASGNPNGNVATWVIEAHCSNAPGTTCSSSADCSSGGVCQIPGQSLSLYQSLSLGYRDVGRLWEARFPVTQRLGSGTYWLSIYGKKESGSVENSYAVSAGEAVVQSNAYRYRQIGFSWVDGGPFFGDVPRDLALEVDGDCKTDADGDLSEAGVDCDDTNPNRYPGRPETCNGIDDNCDNLADSGATPTGVPVLTASRTELSWTVVTGATAFDVVWGTLSALRSSNGDFSTAACAANELTATTLPFSAGDPPVGDGRWYLIRPSSPCGVGTYNTTSPKQVQSRDAEIASSPNACP